MLTPQGSTIKTNLANIYLATCGIVVVEIFGGVIQTIEDAQNTIDNAVNLSDGIKRGILVDLRNAEPLTAKVRQVYKGPNVDSNFTAVAMLIDISPFGRALGNFYINATREGIPKKLFTESIEATDWLATFK